MSRYPPDTTAPPLVVTWQTPRCSCGHRAHEGHCPMAGCSHYVEPPTCNACGHREHGNWDSPCLALGVREDRQCICQGALNTTRKEIDDHLFARGRYRR